MRRGGDEVGRNLSPMAPCGDRRKAGKTTGSRFLSRANRSTSVTAEDGDAASLACRSRSRLCERRAWELSGPSERPPPPPFCVDFDGDDNDDDPPAPAPAPAPALVAYVVGFEAPCCDCSGFGIGFSSSSTLLVVTRSCFAPRPPFRSDLLNFFDAKR
ncbi:hypothetical protein BE221DRAFT_63150 [Ostreococcus tauri]|uniref:Uncharacterized protein n=1 Tax=Ostreococcus tauri TaxID=70448 RepID=A0A1Y5HY38_OSTTA|nr:hypothetical protein BE221DRAFT_63150 [Ostreococcus tauri]